MTQHVMIIGQSWLRRGGIAGHCGDLCQNVSFTGDARDKIIDKSKLFGSTCGLQISASCQLWTQALCLPNSAWKARGHFNQRNIEPSLVLPRNRSGRCRSPSSSQPTPGFGSDRPFKLETRLGRDRLLPTTRHAGLSEAHPRRTARCCDIESRPAHRPLLRC